MLLHGGQPSVQQLLLEPRPGTHQRTAAGWGSHAWGWKDKGWVPPLPLPNGLHFQVLGASEQPSQFSLTNADGTHTTSDGVSSPAPGELFFSSFHNLLSGPYFWSLPASFRGDKVGSVEEQHRQGSERVSVTWPDRSLPLKACPPLPQVTSYGGELRFTVTQRPRPSSAPLHRQPLVVLQGNGIVLEHHASREPSPGQPSNFIVPFREVSPIPSLLVPLSWRLHAQDGKNGLYVISFAASMASA